MVVGQEVAASGFNTKSNIKVAKLPTNTSKVLDFLIVCKLYIKMRMRNILVANLVGIVICVERILYAKFTYSKDYSLQ